MLIKKFRVLGKPCIYDNYSNEFLSVDEIVFNNAEHFYQSYLDNAAIIDQLTRLESKSSLTAFSRAIEEGLFRKPELNEFSFFPMEVIETTLERKLQRIGIILTEECNCRCKYCIHSDIYPNVRNYSEKHMSFETCQKAIGFFFDRCGNTDTVGVSFFGGEPLLEFNLIKKTILYTKKLSLRNNKNVIINITTNGTLLNESIIDFLVREKVNLMISLDGPKEIHDRYRVSSEGLPTYDRIMSKIQYINDFYPDYLGKSVAINFVFAPPYRFNSIEDFIRKECWLFSKVKILCSFMIENNEFLKRYGINPKNSNASMRFQRRKLLEQFVLLESNNNDRSDDEFIAMRNFLRSLFWDDLYSIHERKMGPETPNPFLGRYCIPGEINLMIDPEGNFFTCENLSSSVSIGNLKNGFDFEAISGMISEIKEYSQKECSKCWANRLCKLCYYAHYKGKKFDWDLSKRICESYRKRLLSNIIDYNEIRFKSNDFFDKT